MPYLRDKLCGFAIIICVALTLLGCSAAEPVPDIEPVSVLKADVEATVTPEISAAQADLATELEEPAPAATELPTELMKAETPVIPVSPLRKPQMTLRSDNVQPIEGSEESLAAAVADLSEKSGVSTDDIILVSMEAVDWSDASLGCPQEGFMYAQVITPGYLIVLEADGQPYEYHTDQAGNVVLCETAQK